MDGEVPDMDDEVPDFLPEDLVATERPVGDAFQAVVAHQARLRDDLRRVVEAWTERGAPRVFLVAALRRVAQDLDQEKPS